MRSTPRPLLTAVLTSSLLTGCVVGPNYQRPPAPISMHFKEAEGWRPAHPVDGMDKGAWWSMFNDPVLDQLERRVAISNQTIKEYEAAYREAHQIVAEARSQYFPTVSGGFSANTAGRGGKSGSGNSGGGTGTVTSTGSSATGSTGGATTTSPTAALVTGTGSASTGFSAQIDATWVPDLWGRVRRTVESDRALAQASAADIANATLSAQATLAADYFELRILDEEAALYHQTVADYQRFLQLTVNQYNAGTAARSAVVTAQTQLLEAQSSLVDLGATRAQMEHAIAMLVGVPPAELTIAPAPVSRDVPVPPVDIASSLLERRPDIAAAERRAASANALIGVAESAFYPDLTLTADGGFDASNLGRLFNASSSLWSVGASAADTLLDFGLRRAEVRAARATYDADVATYRQTVLTAFQGVEDELAALRVYQQEEAVRLQAEAAARQAEQLDLNEYKAGVIDYTTVITAQTASLSASQSVLTVLLSRLQASVLLVENLGGGWQAGDLPKG